MTDEYILIEYIQQYTSCIAMCIFMHVIYSFMKSH